MKIVFSLLRIYFAKDLVLLITVCITILYTVLYVDVLLLEHRKDLHFLHPQLLLLWSISKGNSLLLQRLRPYLHAA